jgi:hypothetical protein
LRLPVLARHHGNGPGVSPRANRSPARLRQERSMHSSRLDSARRARPPRRPPSNAEQQQRFAVQHAVPELARARRDSRCQWQQVQAKPGRPSSAGGVGGVGVGGGELPASSAAAASLSAVGWRRRASERAVQAPGARLRAAGSRWRAARRV